MVRCAPMRHKDDDFSHRAGGGSDGLHGRARFPMRLPSQDQRGLWWGAQRRSWPSSPDNPGLHAYRTADVTLPLERMPLMRWIALTCLLSLLSGCAVVALPFRVTGD